MILMKKAATALALMIPAALLAQPFGLPEREANTDLLITELPPDQVGDHNLVNVFPQLTFDRMTFLTEAPDDSNRLFVVSQNGIIYTFPKTEDPAPGDVDVFLDIASKVESSGNEQGLLGFAFAPDYATSGEFYVNYTRDDGASGETVVARYTNAVPSGNTVSAATEEIILTETQPFTNHNGGMIEFGPDGMLYISFGDGGSANDPLGYGQNTTVLHGSILRIDVTSPPDPGLEYAIPDDNPFVVAEGPGGPSTRKEIYAYGFRNPWRFSWDKLNDFLYLGDVGQGSPSTTNIEEVNIVEAGGNYGWSIMEGPACFPIGTTGCDQSGLIRPVHFYTNTVGRAITGGYVYYGTETPELYGKYLFADYVSGKVYAMEYNGGISANDPVQLHDQPGLNISSFGQDNDGEVYLLDAASDRIYKFEQANGPINTFPTRLSQLPALLKAGLGEGHDVPGVIYYEPSAKLWTDASEKERYMAIPGTEQVTYVSDNGWEFPDETVIIKNFLLPLDDRDPQNTLKRVETRLLYLKDDEWSGYSYEWNEEETDAQLLPIRKFRPFEIIEDDGDPLEYEWLYPGRTDCVRCHTPAANHVLGPSTKYFNHEIEYPDTNITANQLETMNYISLFTQDIDVVDPNPAKAPDYDDTDKNIGARARAYLAANCSFCHRPGGGPRTSIDLRWEATNSETGIINQPAGSGDLGLVDAKLINPGKPESSVLLERMKTLDPQHRMPPLGTTRVDENAVDIITEWIMSLEADDSSWLFY